MKLNSASPFSSTRASARAAASDLPHLPEVIAYLREKRTPLCADFARGLLSAKWLTPLDTEQTLYEATVIYDEYLAALASGRTEALQDCAAHVSDRLLARGLDIERILGIVRLLRNIVIRSLFTRFRHVAIWGEADPSSAASGTRSQASPGTTRRRWRVVEGFADTPKPNSTASVPA